MSGKKNVEWVGDAILREQVRNLPVTHTVEPVLVERLSKRARRRGKHKLIHVSTDRVVRPK